MKHRFLASVLLLTTSIVSFALFESDAKVPVEPPVPFEVAVSHPGVAPGQEFAVAAVFQVPEMHHITDRANGLLSFTVNWPQHFATTDTTWPVGVQYEGEEAYRGQVAVIHKVQASEDLQPGTYTIPYDYSYQICTEVGEGMCFLPKSFDGTFTLDVLQSGATPIPSSHSAFADIELSESASSAESATSGNLEDKLTAALEKGSVVAFLLVFLAGILISLTPCVYPMIPIIIGFVGSSAGGSRAKGFILSLFFVLGLVLTYAVLGVVAGASGALFGSFLQDPIVLSVIIVIFVALGASMLGAFDITVPAAVQGKMMSGERSGVLGAIFIGGVTGVVAAPCAGPPLLVLLGWIGNTGNIVLGFFLMATFAAGIGVLFIIIGTFAGAMTALPQAGPWMDKIKKGLGVLIFAVAIYYLSLLVSHAIYLLALGAFLLLVGLFFGALARWEELSTSGRYGKGIGILLLIAGIFYFLLGLVEFSGVSLPAGSAGTSSGSTREAMDEDHVAWRVNDYDAVMADAAAEGKPVLIDFYADWCGVCVELDHKVWNQENVIQASEAYIALKLDYTRSNDHLEGLRQQYGVGGLPTVLILGPDGEERSRFASFREPDDVVDWLDAHAGS